MNHSNKKRINMEESEFDAFLKQALSCSEKLSPQLKEQLFAAMRQQTAHSHGLEGVSLWWLPATGSSVLTLAMFAVLPCFLAGSIFLTLLFVIMSIFCANTWLMTIIGLKLFNLKEVSTL
jgi:hypothetical protein